MKSGFLVFLVLSAVFVPLLLSCVGAESTTTYTLTFNSGGGSAVASQSVESGGKASRPEDPQRAGHSLVNWYVDDSFQTVYDFEQSVTESITLYAAWHHKLKSVIESGTVPSDLSPYGSLVQTVLEPYAAGAVIVARYVATSSQGSGDASSWENAAGDIKATMDNITDAGANKIYLVLLASGTHIPEATLAMKNHVAIVGGWNEWEHTGTSTISGDNARGVFINSGIDQTALLYGVTIANGKSSGNGGGMYNDNSSPTLSHVTFSGNTAAISGGGMYNDNSSSPTLSHVTFTGNTATGGSGGGMYNSNSSPTLSHVTFSGNEARSSGGGMYNGSSSPTLSHVTFSGNEASSSGGGMYNFNSSPTTLSHVTFTGNTANNGGGGMYNSSSSPTLSHVTFTGNTATHGGGMYNDNDVASGPTIVNSLFWNNKGGANPTTNGQQIYMFNDTNSGAENMTIAFSLVQHGIAETSGVTSDGNATDGLGIGGGTDPVTVTQANNIKDDPKLAADLADNGGFVQTIALLENSAAIDKGVYVRRSGTVGSFTFYYSEDSTNWFTDLTRSSSTTLPENAIDLTATDARGYTRSGRPDIGAYEYGGTAP